MRLAGLALAAGKLPQPGQMRALSSRRVTRKRPSRSMTAASDDDDVRAAVMHARALRRRVERDRRGTSASSDTVRHCGLRAEQTVAPKSISAWLKSKTWRWGSTAREIVPQVLLHRVALRIARPTNTRNSTRATFVSRIAARLPNAKLITAPAV